MLPRYSPARFFKLFVDTLSEHKYGFTFIRKYKIYKGIGEYKWVARSLLLIAVILSLKILMDDYTNKSIWDEILKSLIADSTGRYIILILLEVFIFHCSVRTLNIIKNQNKVPKFSDFVVAERRMILVSIRCLVIESILIIAINKVFSIVFLSFAAPGLILLIRFYFTGFIFLDNYNEQYGDSIKESAETVRDYAGVAVAVGMVAFLLFKVPLIGAIAAPVLGSVVASIIMERLKVHGDDERHLHHELVDSVSFSRTA